MSKNYQRESIQLESDAKMLLFIEVFTYLTGTSRVCIYISFAKRSDK